MEILSHPAVKSGLTHCGYSSTLEYITAGVPPLVFPHVAQQAFDSKTLIDGSAAIGIIPSALAEPRVEEEKNMQYSEL